MEERVTRFAIGGVSPGPIRREVTRSAVNLTRVIGSQVTRRDPHRNACGSTPVFSTYAIGWDLPFSDDGDSLGIILACLCDPGTLEIGAGRAHVPVNAHALLADGLGVKLTNGILRDFQVVADAKKPVTLSTVWQFGGLEEEETFPASLGCTMTRAGSPLGALWTVGAARVFAGTLAFTRDATPAGFGLDGKATSLKGKMAVDIVGKITLRMASADGLLAVGSQIEETVNLSLTAGALTFGIAIPRAVLQVTSRRFVSSALTEYSADLLALKTPTNPLASFTLT